MKLKIGFILALGLCFIGDAQGQNEPEFRKAEFPDLFLNQRRLYPQEKSYLHIDRNHYIPGDTVWFCGYAVDASTLLPDTLSRYLYIDLLKPDGTLARQIKVLNRNGAFPGYIPLPDDLAPGNYTLSAYTLFMKESDPDYFFRRSIRVSGLPNERTGNGTDTRPGRKDPEGRATVRADEFHVSFFPEGGYLPVGELWTVGMKALNPDGLAEEISGELFDAEGNRIVSFESTYKGMGSFAFIPEAGKKYYAVCRNRQGHSKRFDFPEPRDDVFALRVVRRGERFYITVATPASTGRVPDRNLTLLLQSRGMVEHVHPLEKGERTAVVDTKTLLSGITQILLLDQENRILSERLVFNHNPADQGYARIHFDRTAYGKREKVRSFLSVEDAEGNPLAGTFSVAVTDDRDLLPDTTYNIVTELLLSSELKGYIESPAWYLEGDEPVRRQALDALMLTQGWRRYEVPELLQGNFERSEALLEVSMEVSGSVKTLVPSRPSAGTPVYMIAPGSEASWMAETDSQGRFSFNGFDYPDSVSFFVRAISRKNNDKVELVLNEPVSLRIVHRPVPASGRTETPADELPDNGRDSLFVEKADRKWTIENGIRTIHLDGVSVRGSAQKPPVNSSFYSGQGTLYGTDYFREKRINHIDQVFKTLVNVKMTPNGEIQIRKLMPDGSRVWVTPSIIIDNSLPIDDFRVWDISLDEIESIEVVPQPTASMSSMYAAYIIITTRYYTGNWAESEESYLNRRTITLQGYQPPVEFYSPKYETTEERNRSLPDLRTTLYWNPDIRTAKEGNAAFEFYTADTAQTTYSVVIEGITRDGRIIRNVGKITIR